MTMGTAATMTAIAEALGMTLPGASSIPAADANHIRMAAESRPAHRRDGVGGPDADEDPDARRVRERHHRGHGDRLLDQRHHPPDRAWRAAPASRRRRSTISTRASRKVPVIANIRPERRQVPDGGFLLRRRPAGADGRRSATTCISTRMTVTGKTLGENIAGRRVYNDDVIRPLDEPDLRAKARSRCCKGNLAPDGCVIKPSRLRAAAPEAHRARRWCSTTIRR